MLRWIPDWVVYALVLSVVLWVVFSGGTDDAPPPPPEAIEQEGAMLPPPSAFDERVLSRSPLRKAASARRSRSMAKANG